MFTSFHSIAHQSPEFALLFDLSYKSAIVLIVGFLAHYLMKYHSASSRSTMWMMVFCGLLFLPWLYFVIPELPVSLTYVGESSSVGGAFFSSAGLIEGLDWIVKIYLAVMLLLLLYLLNGIAKVILSTRYAEPFADPALDQLLNNLKVQNGINSSVMLLTSEDIVSPSTWGIFRHYIVFPLCARNWNPEMMEQVISHELGHIARRDWLQQISARFVVCMLWINPLVWIAHKKFLLESEKSCDDMAIDDTGCSVTYAENLLWLARILNSNRKSISPAFINGNSPLTERIRHILLTNKRSHYIERDSSLPSFLLALLLAAPLSALSFTVQVVDQLTIYAVDQPVTQQILFPVSYFPKDTNEYREFMIEVGKI
jgi:beta-lactamase regulating signal transducer with metallopeptidase domain